MSFQPTIGPLPSLLVVALAAGLSSCIVVTEESSPSSAYSQSVAPPTIDLNEADNAATVRFTNGREVLFAPNGQMVKWSPGTTEDEKSAARRAYQAAVAEKTASPADYSDV